MNRHESPGYNPYDHVPAEWMRYGDQWSASEIAAMKANAAAPWAVSLTERRDDYERRMRAELSASIEAHKQGRVYIHSTTVLP